MPRGTSISKQIRERQRELAETSMREALADGRLKIRQATAKERADWKRQRKAKDK